MYFVITFVSDAVQLIWLYPGAIFPGFSSETNDDLFSGCYLNAYRCAVRGASFVIIWDIQQSGARN